MMNAKHIHANTNTCPTGYRTVTFRVEWGLMCLYCDAGRYQDAPDGHTEQHCKNCPLGYWGRADADSRCEKCSYGTYSGERATKCENCQTGQYQDQKTQSSCKSCAPGFVVNDQQTACMQINSIERISNQSVSDATSCTNHGTAGLILLVFAIVGVS